jgi:poly-gamma-glutamate synthesis protein (capsule biosynthesis protein)
MTRLFLTGDVMTGRGVDQVLPSPGDPRLREAWVRDARDYVKLAEQRNGPIPRRADPGYPWGVALGTLAERAPDVRIVNLETSVTTCDDYWPGKGIHYRMHPANVGCLLAAGLDCCVLANNHMLDFGHGGLAETIATLSGAGIAVAGAGRDAGEARAPAILPARAGGRVLVFAMGSESSGIPAAWAAGPQRAGVDLLPEPCARSAQAVAERIAPLRRDDDIVLVSIHWGGNWGYGVSDAERAFAHALIDSSVVDCVHGHSSHHPRGLEVHRDRLIIYGCGDFVNDYEGISGYEEYHGDLALMYFADMEADTGRLTGLEIVPALRRRFALVQAPQAEVNWLAETLNRESRKLGAQVVAAAGQLSLRW